MDKGLVWIGLNQIDEPKMVQLLAILRVQTDGTLTNQDIVLYCKVCGNADYKITDYVPENNHISGKTRDTS